MLHIITPLYRFNLIEKVYGSIFRNDDITWHISYSNKRVLPDLPFLKNNNQIKIYPVDCEDSDTTSKRNAILSKIKDGYFCFLDDEAGITVLGLEGGAACGRASCTCMKWHNGIP